MTEPTLDVYARMLGVITILSSDNPSEYAVLICVRSYTSIYLNTYHMKRIQRNIILTKFLIFDVVIMFITPL